MTLSALINAISWTNGKGGITGNTIQQLLLQLIASLSVKGRTNVAGTSYQILATDVLVALQRTGTGAALTSGITFTLPSAASFDPQQILHIADETGDLSSIIALTVSASGSDVIVTGGNVVSMQMTQPGQKVAFHTDGASKWTYA